MFVGALGTECVRDVKTRGHSRVMETAEMSMSRYIWASPNSLIGLLFVPTVFFASGGIHVVDGVLELHGSFISWVLRHVVPMYGGASAITFGHVVLGRDEETLARTRVHERVHVRQYELWGPAFIPVYLLAAMWGLVNGTGMYSGNRFEREAMRSERDSRR
jgi:hypothetical protein